jgi:fibronectin type 3 domain-containing protein
MRSKKIFDSNPRYVTVNVFNRSMSLECEYSQDNNINVNFEQIVNITVMKNELKRSSNFESGH